ncbi:hypothetical protein [Niallia oryzisoli]|uniref:hypothetical protein n=1 Tax=Niallia oryzisoli TaxID=1737571 RepID=UPI0037355AEB
MATVKLVKIDGESIHMFNSAIYIFESSSGYTLELEMIVSEVVVRKYKNEMNLIIEIELEDGRIISSIMHVKALSGRLPQLSLYCEINDPEEYDGFDRIHENDSEFPNIEEGITIEEIRKVEMPNERINLKLKLPIDQVEWLQKQKPAELQEFFKEVIYEYWRKQASE